MQQKSAVPTYAGLMVFQVTERGSRFLIVVSIIVCAAVAGSRSARAEPTACPSYQEPRITIDPLGSPETFDNSRPISGILQLVGEKRDSYAGLREMPVGLTISNLRLDSFFDIKAAPAETDSSVCAQIMTLNLAFGFEGTTVYVAHEVPQGSCGYHEVLDHEAGHVAIDRDVVAAYLPRLRELLADELRRVGVIRASSFGGAETVLNDAIHDYLRELGSNIASARDQRQREHDSPEEYRQLSTSCGGELTDIIGQAAQQL
jgi:hypothetical protein